MEKTIEKITSLNVDQALAEGYTFCMEEDQDCSLIALADVKKNPDDYKEQKLVLCEKEPRFMTFSSDEISDLITEQIDNQEEFYSDDLSSDAIEGTDELLQALSDKINANLSKRKFYFNSEIRLNQED